ncbi:MAG: transposase [Acetobacteraceae bacterium]|nr:transposase [Acetobacteraceae bacterium]
MRRSPYTPRRPWAPLSDAEGDALAPFVTRETGPGRPLRDPRGRLDAMLRNTLADRPWRDLPPEDGKPDTVSRLFRRWVHAGVWMRLLEALKAPDAPAALRGMEYWICRLVRRSIWVLRRARRGLHEIVRIKRLGLHTALPQHSFALFQPDLSELLHRVIARVLHRMPEELPPPGTLTALGRLLAFAGGRRVWSKRLAPP